MIQGDIIVIGSRLREFRLRTNIKMPVVAAATGIAKETLYKWEKGTRPSNLAEYFKLKLYLDRMENIFEAERLDKEDQKPATLQLPLSFNKPAIPQTESKAAAGTVLIVNEDPVLIVDRISAPFIGMVEGVIEISGESMAPTFGSGNRIGISRLKDPTIIDYGKYYYIIDYNWHGMVRRIYQGENQNCIKLVSDNADQEKFPPVERSWGQIACIFKIIASINLFK